MSEFLIPSLLTSYTFIQIHGAAHIGTHHTKALIHTHPDLVYVPCKSPHSHMSGITWLYSHTCAHTRARTRTPSIYM